MSLWNPWREIRRLEAELVEALAANSSFVAANRKTAESLNRAIGESRKLQDDNWSLRLENNRLGSLVEHAVLRDPDTGRLLPKRVHSVRLPHAQSR